MQRTTAERGWRLAGLLALFVIAFLWMPLGARDAAGVSSVIPALGSPTLAQPTQVSGKAVAQHLATVAQPAPRPLPVRARSILWATGFGLVAAALVVVHLVGDRDDLRTGLLPGALRSRGPPAVL